MCVWGGGGRFTELQSFCPYLDELSKGVSPFPGETTPGQINGADRCLVLNALTKHYKGRKNLRSRIKILTYCMVTF